MSLNDLKNRARQARDENQLKANTATRIGQILMDIIDYISVLFVNTHTHTNKTVLDQLTDSVGSSISSSGGKLQYRGLIVESSTPTPTLWVDPPVLKIVAALPLIPNEGDRYIYSPNGRIFEYITDSWVIDSQTDPNPVEGSVVIVRYNSLDEETNHTYLYINGEWIDKDDDYNTNNQRYVTSWDGIIGRRLIILTGSPDSISSTGLYSGRDNVIGNPIYELGIGLYTEFVYYIHLNHDSISAHQEAYVDGDIYRRDKVNNLWGSWSFSNTSGTNTGDQVGDGVTITGTGSGEDPFVAVNGVVHEHTYDELIALCTVNSLKIGDLYLLTDYETTYTQPVTDLEMSSGVIEPLLLTASSVNTFDTICSSALYHRDIISYDINDSSEGFTKGKIFRRNDTINSIDAGTDWRHVKYFRAELDVTTAWVQGNNYTIGDIVTTGYDIYICTLTHTNSGDVNTNFYHYPFGNGDFASLYSTGQPIFFGDVEYIIPVSVNFEDRLKFGSSCSFQKWDMITFDNIIIGNGNNYWTVGNGNGYFTIGNDNNYLTVGNGNGYFTIGNDNNYWTVGDGNGYFTVGNGNGYFTVGDSNYSFTVGDSFLNYEIKNYTLGITPPNISADYLKTIYKAGTKQILEYTDEFGDVNIIEL